MTRVARRNKWQQKLDNRKARRDSLREEKAATERKLARIRKDIAEARVKVAKLSPEAREVDAPVDGVTQDSWGWHPGVHDGIDLICPPNAPLHAIVHSKVVRASASGWWGNNPTGNVALGDGIIILESLVDAGPIKKGMKLCYGHAEGATVTVGQIVEAGDRIGHAGLANAWHVHFMVHMRPDVLGKGDRDPRPVWNYARDHGS